MPFCIFVLYLHTDINFVSKIDSFKLVFEILVNEHFSRSISRNKVRNHCVTIHCILICIHTNKCKHIHLNAISFRCELSCTYSARRSGKTTAIRRETRVSRHHWGDSLKPLQHQSTIVLMGLWGVVHLGPYSAVRHKPLGQPMYFSPVRRVGGHVVL